MKLTKVEFEAIEGVKSYQLVNEANLIVGVTSGFGSKENEVTATLFENAPIMLDVLTECRSAFIMLGLIDKSNLSNELLEKVENVLKSVGAVS
jgi:hypothetical protein